MILFRKLRVVSYNSQSYSHGAGVLGDSLGSLGESVLGELSWEDELDSRLDLLGGEGVLLVVSDELSGLGGDLLEDIVDEGVHDGHGSLGDTGLWVNLLEDSVDIDGEGLDSLGLSLHDGGSLDGFLSCWGSSSGFGWHFNIKFIIFF